jgi:hypothetical protein
MGRTRKTIRPIEKNISLPETLVAEVDLLLYSELEGRVPYGAWKGLVQMLLEKFVEDVKRVRKETV